MSAAVTCPVVHTTLNWIVIALLVLWILTLVGAVVWSAIDHERDRRAAAAASMGESGPLPAAGDWNRVFDGRVH